MSGLDFLLARAVPLSELHAALSSAFDDPEATVDVAYSIEDTSGEAAIVGDVTETRGDFKTLVALYTAEDRHVGVDEIARVARALQTDAVISDDSHNPYTMLLIRPDGSVHPVAFDPVSLDERDEYRLSARQPTNGSETA